MPRIANSGTKVDQWYEIEDEGTSTFDVCRKCWSKLGGKSLKDFDLEPYQRGEPTGDSTIIVEPHPEYEDEDGYECEVCDRPLGAKDN